MAFDPHLSFDEIIALTDEALLLVDPEGPRIEKASPRAAELLQLPRDHAGRALGETLCLTEAFGDFLRRAGRATQMLVSTATRADRSASLFVRGRRVTGGDGAPRLLLVLQRDTTMAQRFALLQDNVRSLQDQIVRRRAAEGRLARHTRTLEATLNAVRAITGIETRSGRHVSVALRAIVDCTGCSGAVLFTPKLGRMRRAGSAGDLGGSIPNGAELDLPLAEYEALAQAGLAGGHARILSVLDAAAAPGRPVSPRNPVLVPIRIRNEGWGLAVLAPPAQGGSIDPVQAEILAEALSALVDRAEIEANLIQSQKLQAVGMLTGGVAHDFNNLLAVVMGNAELLQHGEDNAELVESIRLAAERGAALTAKLLTFARKQPLKAVPTDVGALLAEVEPLIAKSVGQAVALTVRAAPDAGTILVDQAQFTSALINLAVNARDAMDATGALVIEAANVALDADYASKREEVRPGNYLVLRVRDTGPGIDPAILDDVFTPFFTTKEVGRGSGLGLSMVYGFVKQSGGHVTVETEPGTGTQFDLYFPRTDLVPDPGPPRQVPAPARRRGGHVLLVEDDAAVRTLTVKSLTLSGYTVDSTASGDEALGMLARGRYDILLTDVILPGKIDGRTLAARCATVAPRTVAVLMSGYTDPGGGRDAPRLLAKPFSRRELVDALEAAMREHGRP
jgi:signal transduction histidine kinase